MLDSFHADGISVKDYKEVKGGAATSAIFLLADSPSGQVTLWTSSFLGQAPIPTNVNKTLKPSLHNTIT